MTAHAPQASSPNDTEGRSPLQPPATHQTADGVGAAKRRRAQTYFATAAEAEQYKKDRNLFGVVPCESGERWVLAYPVEACLQVRPHVQASEQGA